MLLSMFSFGQEQNTESPKSNTFVENEFIIWLEKDVDASTLPPILMLELCRKDNCQND